MQRSTAEPTLKTEPGRHPRRGSHRLLRPLDAASDASELSRSIATGRLVVHYQPKVNLVTGRAVGVEALVRWQHPDRGLIFPDEFIPLAEGCGVLPELTAFVLDEAARQHAHWQSIGLDLPVAVNLSTGSLLDDGLPGRIAALCDRHRIDRHGIELEITETSVMTDPVGATAVLDALVREGFAIAIDDFGTGFSSLSYLRDLPVSTVKIDKSFVLDVAISDADAHIVRGTIELARGLGKQVVAEGVETAEAVDLLLLMGCDYGQGHYWSRSLPAPELTAWVLAHHDRLAIVEPGEPVPEQDAKRLAVLRRYRILDTAYEAIFDDIAAAAARICGTPMSAITLVDADRQWFKAHVGINVRETARNLALCAHTIMDPTRMLVINDATADGRFATNPLVTADPNIRFYAGAPLVSPGGSAVGSLCVLDSTPRHLSTDQLNALRQLSTDVIALLEARQRLADVAERFPDPQAARES